MKKSIFSRIFIINIAVVLLSMLVLAVSSYFLISHYIYSEKVEMLEDNANSISRFINTGVTTERIENFLYGFSHSSNCSIFIIDKNCKVLIEAAPELEQERGARYIDSRFCENVLKGKEHVERGTLGGVYDTEMVTLQLPVFDRTSKQLVGAIFISITAPEMMEMQIQIFKTMGVAIVIALLLAFALSYALSKTISKPIKGIQAAVKKFAKGDYSSRVEQTEQKSNIAEIEELSAAFNNMAFHLEKADEIRNNFISDVSHDLRTPMTTIAGFVDGILDGTIPQERERDYLAIVKGEISRLSALVNSFLDITRIEGENKPLEMINFDINESIRRILFGFEKQITEKYISVELIFETDACFVRADRDLITRVITNLAENAIKFTENGGTIRISTAAHQQEIVVSVYNTGCGISENDKEFIFERFYKADKSRSLNREGTGIGLYIVKDIINRHGKNISVKSVENEYAQFTFWLDRGKA